MFSVNPVEPEPIVTLSTVPLTSVLTPVPPDTPLTCALSVKLPAGAAEPLLVCPFHVKSASPADCAPRLIELTSTPALLVMLSTTDELVCGTFTAPLTVAPAVARDAVELVTSAWWPRSEDACSAWLETSELESAENEVVSSLMPC